MLNVVGKRGWYFLFSAFIIIPGLISMILPPGWASLNSGFNPGIDFTSGSVLQISFEEPVNEEQIRERLSALGHPEALIQKIGSRSAFIRTVQLKEAVQGGLSEREVIERDFA